MTLLKLQEILSTLLVELAMFLIISSNKGLSSDSEDDRFFVVSPGATTTYFQKAGFLHPAATMVLALTPSMTVGWYAFEGLSYER